MDQVLDSVRDEIKLFLINDLEEERIIHEDENLSSLNWVLWN